MTGGRHRQKKLRLWMATVIARVRLGLEVAVVASSGEARARSWGGDCCPRRRRGGWARGSSQSGKVEAGRTAVVVA